MPTTTEPHNPLNTTTTARKHQAPLDGNGDRIELPTKKQRAQPKKSDTVAKDQKQTHPLFKHIFHLSILKRLLILMRVSLQIHHGIQNTFLNPRRRMSMSTTEMMMMILRRL